MKKTFAMILAAIGLSLIASLPSKAQERTALFTTEVIVCMQNALEARDNKIADAIEKFGSDAKASVILRKALLQEAWALKTTQEVKTSIKAAWADYKKSISNGRRSMNASKKAAWLQYKKDHKACNAPSNFDTTTENADTRL